MSWHLPAGYVENLTPAYWSAARQHELRDGVPVVWQPDVYPWAKHLAYERGLTGMVDVGCGRGDRLMESGLERLVGIDMGRNVEFCRATHGAAAEWFDIDLERMAGIEAVPTEGAVIVCADVIEHLLDPSSMLDWFAAIGAPIVMSTPDRELSGRRGGRPPRTHVREWSMREFLAVLRDFGLPVTAAGHTRANSAVARRKTCLVVIR